jgi:hypothetical protein
MYLIFCSLNYNDENGTMNAAPESDCARNDAVNLVTSSAYHFTKFINLATYFIGKIYN